MRNGCAAKLSKHCALSVRMVCGNATPACRLLSHRLSSMKRTGGGLNGHGEILLGQKRVGGGQCRDPGRKLRRNGSEEGHTFARGWMCKGEASRVEHEPPWFRFLPCRVGIDDVSDEGVSKMQHVDAYLVGTPSVQGTTYQGAICRRVVVEEFIVRDGRFPTPGIDDSHF